MSIITQALKKAQHEQRLQQTRRTHYGSLTPFQPQVDSQRPARRPGLIVAGVGLFVGIGIITYTWQSVRAPLPIAMTVPTTPQPAAEPEFTLDQSTPAPGLQASNRLQLGPTAPTAPAPGANMARLTAPPTRQALQIQPAPSTAQPSAPPTPAPTAAPQPEMSQAEKRARAQQQFDSGLVAYNAGAFDEAEFFLQQAIDLDPTLKRAFNSLGNLYYQREAYEQALAMYQEALAIDPDYIKARNNLGNTYMQLDMSFKAITELTKAIMADSESGLAYYNMACVYARSSEPEKAIRYLEMAIARDPEARHWAKTDTDFTAVRSTSAFQKLLGTSS